MDRSVERLLVEPLPYASARGAEKDAARFLVEAIDESGVPRFFARRAEGRVFAQEFICDRPATTFSELDRVSACGFVHREDVTIVEEEFERHRYR
jgi:hypothetical protein